MTARTARATLQEVLEGARADLTVDPNPPRQVGNTPVVFFAGMRRERSAQDGTNTLVVTLLAIAGTQNDWSFDELDDLCDAIDAVIDTTVDGVSIFAGEAGEWQAGGHEIGGQQFIGATLDVEVHY